ncbi:MAG TPA: hypothetical protein VF828_03675, partial [Patescibacteria group bacterium]
MATPAGPTRGTIQFKDFLWTIVSAILGLAGFVAIVVRQLSGWWLIPLVIITLIAGFVGYASTSRSKRSWIWNMILLAFVLGLWFIPKGAPSVDEIKAQASVKATEIALQIAGTSTPTGAVSMNDAVK